MAMTVTEKITTGTLTIQNGKWTARRIFDVSASPGSPAVLNELQILNASGIPAMRTAHPRVYDLFSRNYSIKHVEGHAGQWIVEVEYESRDSFASTPPPDTGIGGVEKSVSYGYTLVDTWRTNTNLPGSPSAPTEVDIGGIPVDAGGYPIVLSVTSARFDITKTIEGTGWNSLVLAMINIRNSDSFYGAAPGRMLFLGADARSDPGTEVYHLTYHFGYDRDYHLRQHVQRDPVTREPTLGTAENGAPEAMIGKGYPVYYKQLFPTTAPFSAFNLGGI